MLFQRMMGTCSPLFVVTTVAEVPSAFMQENVDASTELAFADEGIIVITDSKAKEIVLARICLPMGGCVDSEIFCISTVK